MVNIEKLSSAYVWGFEQGQEEERLRIIKLLEANHLTAASELIEEELNK